CGKCLRPVPSSAFFFQAEDGIRDKLVTGVKTCALPISDGRKPRDRRQAMGPAAPSFTKAQREVFVLLVQGLSEKLIARRLGVSEIGRASCRERGWTSVGEVVVKTAAGGGGGRVAVGGVQ